MPDYRRFFVPAGTYFFTINLYDRSSDLLVSHIRELRLSWTDVETAYPFETIAVCVLPDHLHCIIALPAGDQNFPDRIGRLKSGFTRRLPESLKSNGRKRERNIWQQRYWEHVIRDADDLEAHVNYTHYNPVRHGNVSDMDEWPYSTWHRYKKEISTAWKPPLLNIDPHDP